MQRFRVPLTSEVHPGLQTLSYAARRAVFPSDLVDDAVVPAGAQVVVLTWVEGRRCGLFILRWVRRKGGGGRRGRLRGESVGGDI